MTTEEAQAIAREFEAASGYSVVAQSHGLLVTESEGRTSFFTEKNNFFRFIESVVARTHPI